MQIQKVISNCEQYIQHTGTCTKAPMQPIIVTAPLELLHITFTSIEINPQNIMNILVLCDHFTKKHHGGHDPNQTARTIDKFLWQDISQSSEHWQSSWVTEEPTLKATSSESFATLWTCRRLGLSLTMLKPMDKLSKLTKC